MAVAGDGNRSSIDRKTKKKNTDQRPARERKKPEVRARKKDSLSQPVNTTGRRTLGMGDAAPDGGHGGRLPGGGMRVRKRRRLGFRTWVAGLLQLPTPCFCLDLDLDLGRRRRRHHLACVRERTGCRCFLPSPLQLDRQCRAKEPRARHRSRSSCSPPPCNPSDVRVKKKMSFFLVPFCQSVSQSVTQDISDMHAPIPCTARLFTN